MMRPRVLHVNKLYHPWVGGVEKVVQDLAEGLAKEFEVQVLVCQPRGLGRADRINGIRVIRAGSFGTYLSMPVSPSFPWLLRKLSRQADIIHLHLPFPLATAAWSGKRSGQRLVISYHSDIVRQRWLQPVYSPSLRRVLDEADAIIVSSPNLAAYSEFLQPYQGKCHIIPFFIDLDKYTSHRQVQYTHLSLPIRPKHPLVLFVGRLVYYKGVEYLIRAMQKVDATLLLAGTGPLENHLRILAKKLNVEEKVYFLGRVSDEILQTCYQACSCLVLPSIEPTEAFGLVQLEAMAYGKPVVNTNLPTGVPFVSVHGETGFTVPPRDVDALAEAIRQLCENEELRLRLGQQARKRVETIFSKEAVLPKVRALYYKLLS